MSQPLGSKGSLNSVHKFASSGQLAAHRSAVGKTRSVSSNAQSTSLQPIGGLSSKVPVLNQPS